MLLSAGSSHAPFIIMRMSGLQAALLRLLVLPYLLLFYYVISNINNIAKYALRLFIKLLTVMWVFIVRYIPIGLEPVQALLRITVVVQRRVSASAVLPPAALTTIAVWLVFCCCNNNITRYNMIFCTYVSTRVPLCNISHMSSINYLMYRVSLIAPFQIQHGFPKKKT